LTKKIEIEYISHIVYHIFTQYGYKTVENMLELLDSDFSILIDKRTLTKIFKNDENKKIYNEYRKVRKARKHYKHGPKWTTNNYGLGQQKPVGPWGKMQLFYKVDIGGQEIEIGYNINVSTDSGQKHFEQMLVESSTIKPEGNSEFYDRLRKYAEAKTKLEKILAIASIIAWLRVQIEYKPNEKEFYNELRNWIRLQRQIFENLDENRDSVGYSVTGEN
jgi:hypothetical protein